MKYSEKSWRKFELTFWISLLLILMILIAVSGCSTWAPMLSTDVNYQRDLKIEIEYWNGKKYTDKESFVGFGLAKIAKKYKIKVFPEGHADMLTGTTCHREWKKDNPKSSWNSSGVSFEYEPLSQIETEKNCPLDIGIYEKKKGRHGWAMIEFDDERMSLAAQVKCNGVQREFGGVSICQAKETLVQKITFEIPVDHQAIAGCEISKSENKMEFWYLMPMGDCTIHFCAYKDENRCHKHTMFGYHNIPIRGVQ